jgi:hypothetical protein
MKNYKAGHKKSLRLSARQTLFGLGGLVLVAGVLAVLDSRNIIDLPFFADKPATTSPTSSDGVNYGPPTEEEKQEASAFKDSIGNGSTAPSPSSTGSSKTAVTPVITSWGYTSDAAQVSSYVQGVIEGGGTCTLTLSKAGQKVSELKSASANAQNTACGLISIAGSRLSSGSWSGVISYDSASSQGVSQTVTIEVP